MNVSKTLILSLAVCGVLASCGGGGDAEAGAPVTFSVIPDTVTFTAPAGSPTGVCYSGGTSTIFIYGGAAPYRIDNTVPDAVSVDKTSVSDPGGSFALTVTSASCLSTAQIVVVDKLNNTVTLKVNNNPAATS